MTCSDPVFQTNQLLQVLKHFTRIKSPLVRPHVDHFEMLHSQLRRSELHRLPGNWTNALAHSVCHTPGTLIYLTNKLETGMMDSDSVVTCSLPLPLIAHQLAYLSINLSRDIHAPQIIYRLSFLPPHSPILSTLPSPIPIAAVCLQ